jgi:GNAT superfamily N-acetyltransferase
MSSAHFASGMDEHTLLVTRVADRHWHALDDDQVVGRGEAWPRPDGRIFLSIDSWDGMVFDQLADVMLADLPRPLYTVVDEAELALTAGWQRAGFTTGRREWEYLVPTDPQITGLGSLLPPTGVTIVPVGKADERLLRDLDRTIRSEVAAGIGWEAMPAELLPRRPDGTALLDPSKYAVAALSDRYVGLVRMALVTRQPRIGLIAVRADHQRRGIAQGLLAHVLGALHRCGTEAALAEVDENNEAAIALFESAGAWRASSNLELVLRDAS